MLRKFFALSPCERVIACNLAAAVAPWPFTIAAINIDAGSPTGDVIFWTGLAGGLSLFAFGLWARTR